MDDLFDLYDLHVWYNMIYMICNVIVCIHMLDLICKIDFYASGWDWHMHLDAHLPDGVTQYVS